MKKPFSALLLLFLSISTSLLAGTSATSPKVEMLTDPIGLGCATPRFSWQITSSAKGVQQTSYRIMVASSLEKLKQNVADVWDSGVKSSDHSLNIRYEGPSLQSRKRYYWKAIVKTNRGNCNMKPSFWEMGLTHSSDWSAQWIGRSYDTDYTKGDQGSNTKVKARYLRKDFDVENSIQRATLYISGLGLYEAYINGSRIGKQELAPGPTDYNFRVKYNTFDVTGQVKKGGNAIGIILGNGRFMCMRNPGQSYYGLPRLLAQLEITMANGQKKVITSDTSWKITAEGPIGNNNEFDGEDYDARKEMPGWNRNGFNDAAWQQAETVDAPKGKLDAQQNPNIMKMDLVKPVSIKELKPNVYILDMGQNMVGWLKMKVKGQRGEELKLHFAETLTKDGGLYTANLRSAQTTDTYILKGEKEEIWEPSFTYHGFRYVEMTGFKTKPNLADIEGEVLYDDMANSGHFECSNAVFNQVYKNAYWGIRGNYRGMPTDCPQRDERMGWLGDRGIGCMGEAYLFNNHQLYSKWIDDIGDDQREDGAISDVSPIFWPVYNENMTWPAAWLTATNMLYDQYGDEEPIIKHYAGMKKWMNHMKEKYMTNLIITRDVYGDWCMPPESPELIHSKDPARITDGKLLGTSFYYLLSDLMAKFAHIAGHEEDVAMWKDMAAQVKDAFNKEFFHADKGYYANNTVTSNILPLRFGMVAEEHKSEVFKNIVEKTTGEFKSHVSTGLIGIQQLMRGLTDYGRGDLAWTIATNTTYPSWGYMAKEGATTIWELWNGNTADPAMNSGNHVMLLGDLIVWTYQYLAGIGQTEGSTAFKEIQLKPWPITGLEHVKASYDSPYGLIQSSWKKENGHFIWDFEIPGNTTALVYVPTKAKLTQTELDAIHKMGGTLNQEKSSPEFTAFQFVSGKYKLDVNY